MGRGVYWNHRVLVSVSSCICLPGFVQKISSEQLNLFSVPKPHMVVHRPETGRQALIVTLTLKIASKFLCMTRRVRTTWGKTKPERGLKQSFTCFTIGMPGLSMQQCLEIWLIVFYQVSPASRACFQV